MKDCYKTGGHVHKPMAKRHDDSKMAPSHDSAQMKNCYKKGGAVTHPGHSFAEKRRAMKSGPSNC